MALLNSAPYRAGPRVRGYRRLEIAKMLETVIIEPATTDWVAPIVVGYKRNGSSCFRVDYRKLNVGTRRDFYLVARMGEFIDFLSDYTLLFIFDVNCV